jgi:glyoxylase-like metal-dependent hydrolase (beta-lactamase superfamily II)
MVQQIPVGENAVFKDLSGDPVQIIEDLAYKRLGIANIVLFGRAHFANNRWVLIDAGVAGTFNTIIRTAENRYGEGARPEAIILTHGHFDHVGVLTDLAEHWDVPIYAHELERPYLTGLESFPPPDPSVGGGIMASLSRFFPRDPVDASRWLQDLPADGRVPAMPGWQWLHTPGHTRGHVSLWREFDRTLIAGDAFITTAQESAYAVLTQQPELHGPPMYYTTDWDSASASVAQLAALDPEVVITGHGPPLRGQGLREALHTLSDRFEVVAVPAQGRYVDPPNLPK